MSGRARTVAAIFAGGFLGAILRGALSRVAPVQEGAWPWTTLAVNVAGALLLGYFATRLEERLPTSRYRRALLGTGFCGALTTFSTMELELDRMLDAGHLSLAVTYAAVSVLLGFAALVLASRFARRSELLA